MDLFFADSHLPLGKIVELMYWWADIDTKQSIIMKQIGVAAEGIVNWYNYVHNICTMWSIDHPMQLGGNSAIVEIDCRNLCTGSTIAVVGLRAIGYLTSLNVTPKHHSCAH